MHAYMSTAMLSSDFHAEMFVVLSGPLICVGVCLVGPGIVLDMQGSNHVMRVSKYLELSSSEDGSGECVEIRILTAGTALSALM